MLRGYIESVKDGRVSGWIHAEGKSLNNKRILAFAGAQCVAAGTVGIYRKDLHDAGLGDGRLGFAIELPRGEPIDAASIAVRLDGSDLWLVQPGAVIAAARPTAWEPPPDRLQVFARCQWMLRQGWLTQIEYDFLKNLCQAGVHERSLSVKGAGGAVALAAAQDVAAQGFSIHFQRDAGARAVRVADAAALQALRQERLQGAAREYLVALHAHVTAPVGVREGSQYRSEQAPGPFPAIDYTLGERALLFWDVRTEIDAARFFATPGAAMDVLVPA